MVNLTYTKRFQKAFSKIRDNAFKIHIKNQINKIIETPEIGKPMRYKRKGTRELYVGSFRLAYSYSINEDEIIFLELYHKDEQ
jgi:mRNA-degrading endonuclease RelE of RelBE toxin-antitoxin system